MRKMLNPLQRDTFLLLKFLPIAPSITVTQIAVSLSTHIYYGFK